MFGIFLAITVLGELAVLIYFFYALPALWRSQPLGKRRVAGFIASTLAIPPIGGAVLAALFLLADIVSKEFGMQASDYLEILLSSLILIWIGSTMCAGVLREYFRDRGITKPPLIAAGWSTIIVGGPGAMVIGSDFEWLLGLILILAAVTWHAITSSGVLKRASVLRANRLRDARLCVMCRYDLRGIAGDVCPECGMQVAGRATTAMVNDGNTPEDSSE